MKRTIIYTITCLLILLPSVNRSAKERTITMGATDWCPYTCPSRQDGGLVTSYLKEVFQILGVKLEVRFYPWVRAINYAKTGEIDGLLTAVKSEVPDLLLTTTPTMSYQTCFYTLKDDEWKYTGEESLNLIKTLSVAEGYGYGEPLDSYIANGANNIVSISGDKLVDRMVNMLLANRISAFAQDPLIIEEYNGLNSSIISKGCQNSLPFFIAFRKTNYFKSELIPALDEVLKTSSKTGAPVVKQEKR